MYPLLMETIGQPHGSTPVDCLIADFSKQNNISYLHVTHDVQYGCVTNKKKKNDEPIVEDEESDFISVYTEKISAWRRNIKLCDDQTILVVFAWCSNDLRFVRFFPEYKSIVNYVLQVNPCL